MPFTLLIVDDNDAFRGMLCTALAMRGHVAIPARSGLDALALVADDRIEAVLADIDMPGMDGFELAQRLDAQSRSAGREVPVWIMTGTLRPGLDKRAAKVGAVLLLRKPLRVEDTCAQIEAELNRRKALAS